MSILSRDDILECILEGEKVLFEKDTDEWKIIKDIKSNIKKKEKNKIIQLFNELYREIRKDKELYKSRIDKIERKVRDVRDEKKSFEGILFDDFDVEKLQASNYDLRLGREVYTTGEKQPKKLGRGNDTVKIEPGEFGVFLTHELVYIPNNLLGLISLKSKYKLKGLVNVSGFHVDPGYHGKILFSVYNAGPNTIFLRYKEDVFMIMFDRLDNPTSEGYNKEGYKNIPVETISGLQGAPVSLRELHEKVNALERNIAIGKWVLGTIIVALLTALIARGGK